MVEKLAPGSGGLIIEVGPGRGIITQKLLGVPKIDVIAIELDGELSKTLKEKFRAYANIQIVNADILKWLEKNNVEIVERGFGIIGSIPYSITSPLIHKIIGLGNTPRICVFLVQKEVAEKICAAPPKANYLSSLTQTFFYTDFIKVVPKELFFPKPAVDGAIIALTKRPRDVISHDEKLPYQKFLHRGFSNPRKMLDKVLTKDELVRGNVRPTLRPQNLDAKTWAALFKMTD